MNTVIFLEKTAAEEKAPTTIPELLARIEHLFKTEPAVEKDIHIQLTSIVSQLFHAALNSQDGYCFKFNLPIVQVQSIYKKIKTSPSMVEEIFRSEWKYPKNTRMYSDSYYQILLLMLYYGLKNNNKTFVNNSLLIILIKLWNGQSVV